jgi:hypothetical protein
MTPHPGHRPENISGTARFISLSQPEPDSPIPPGLKSG